MTDAHQYGNAARGIGHGGRPTLLEDVAELLGYGSHHGQAGTYDTEERFHGGQECDERVSLLCAQAVWIANGGCHLDAIGSYSADPAMRCISVIRQPLL